MLCAEMEQTARSTEIGMDSRQTRCRFMTRSPWMMCSLGKQSPKTPTFRCAFKTENCGLWLPRVGFWSKMKLMRMGSPKEETSALWKTRVIWEMPRLTKFLSTKVACTVWSSLTQICCTTTGSQTSYARLKSRGQARACQGLTWRSNLSTFYQMPKIPTFSRFVLELPTDKSCMEQLRPKVIDLEPAKLWV